MLHLNIQGLKDRSAWEAAGIALPRYDVEAMKARTLQRPSWVHFGAAHLTARLQRDVERGIRMPDVIGRSLSRVPLYEGLSTVKVDVSEMTAEQAAEAIMKL